MTIELTPEQRKAALVALISGHLDYDYEVDVGLNALIAAGWGPVTDAEARGYRAGIEAALTTKIQLAEATAGPEPTLERMIRVYYTARIDDWDLASQYADELLAAIRALPEKLGGPR